MPASEAELRELYARYAHVLHHRARAILGSDEDADDAVQETFARVILHHDTFRQQSSPLTWMYQISTNYCLNRLRARKGHARKHEDHRDEIVGSRESGEVELDAARVRALLEAEDDETRRIVIHLFFDDMTREQAAVAVGISVPTLRKRVDAFLKRARRELGIVLVQVAVVLLTLLRWWR